MPWNSTVCSLWHAQRDLTILVDSLTTYYCAFFAASPRSAQGAGGLPSTLFRHLKRATPTKAPRGTEHHSPSFTNS